MNRILFHEWGFRGNVEHYTDPRNSFLDQVLVRRKGIPLSLSTVYLLIAERLGLELEPVGLPGHFIVGCFTDDLPVSSSIRSIAASSAIRRIFEALRATHVVPKPSDLAPTPVREVLCRSCRNLVNHYTAAGRYRTCPALRRLRRGIRGRLRSGTRREFWISDSRFWILRAARTAVSIENLKSKIENPEDVLTLARPRTRGPSTAPRSPCSAIRSSTR